MMAAIAKDLGGIFGRSRRARIAYFQVAHSCNDEEAQELKAALEELYPGNGRWSPRLSP